MSSPSENLKKNKRSPLPNPLPSTTNGRSLPHTNRPTIVPSIGHQYTNNIAQEREHIAPHTTPFTVLADSYLHRDILQGIRREGKVSDSESDLVSSMASRLAAVERELLNAKREIIEKVNNKSE